MIPIKHTQRVNQYLTTSTTSKSTHFRPNKSVVQSLTESAVYHGEQKELQCVKTAWQWSDRYILSVYYMQKLQLYDIKHLIKIFALPISHHFTSIIPTAISPYKPQDTTAISPYKPQDTTAISPYKPQNTTAISPYKPQDTHSHHSTPSSLASDTHTHTVL